MQLVELLFNTRHCNQVICIALLSRIAHEQLKLQSLEPGLPSFLNGWGAPAIALSVKTFTRAVEGEMRIQEGKTNTERYEKRDEKRPNSMETVSALSYVHDETALYTRRWGRDVSDSA